ncbi:MAG: hypothetical protein SOZ62_03265 [Eubacteriales bacterium]|nr:hypothetical protein [Eubacteriales bacterium]
MDMVEALNGVLGYVNSYLDYAYFGVIGADFDFSQAVHFGVGKPDGSSALIYWIPKNILAETIETTVSLSVKTDFVKGDVHLVDLLSGDIYALPPEIMNTDNDGNLCFNNVPATDSPMMITFGDFCS